MIDYTEYADPDRPMKIVWAWGEDFVLKQVQGWVCYYGSREDWGPADYIFCPEAGGSIGDQSYDVDRTAAENKRQVALAKKIEATDKELVRLLAASEQR